MRCKALAVMMIIMCLSMIIPTTVAENTANDQRYYFGLRPDETVNAGKDTGYSEVSEINKDDPHYGWSIGYFYVTGYTRHIVEGDKPPIFLKNVGDKVVLWFQLEQDITCLNGESGLVICEDINGYDEYFGIKQTNFGRGTIIIRHTDYQNNPGEPVIYTDYLAATATNGAAVQVELFEEGDYEIALDYEVKNIGVTAFGEDFLSGYNNYRLYFRFSVRNGNCMVYPFDVVTGSELTNSSSTENGFSLNMAMSRYLDVDITRAVINETGDGLVEDVRFNRPVNDGEKYTEEGVYTITVKNKYTQQSTVKVIYVGSDEVVAAHVDSEIPIDQLREMINSGACIIENGEVIMVSSNTGAVSDSQGSFVNTMETEGVDECKYDVRMILITFICGMIVGGVLAGLYFVKIQKNRQRV